MNSFVYTWYLRFLRDRVKLSASGYYMGHAMGGYWVGWVRLPSYDFIRKYQL